MSHNQQLKGKDFGYRFLWRMVLLAGFATLNAAFFPAGDVLLLFVVVSLVLFIVRKWSDKAILITAILFSLQPIEWFHYIMSLCNPAYTLPDSPEQTCFLSQSDIAYQKIPEVSGFSVICYFSIHGLYIGRKELFVAKIGRAHV